MKTKKVYEHFPGIHPDPRSFSGDTAWVLPKCFIGLEVELEGLRGEYQGLAPYWVPTADHSLREVNGLQAVELKFSQPLCGLDLSIAIHKLDSWLKRLKTAPIRSPRTSTHVHLDARELEISELASGLVLYALFESALFHFAGPDRENNLYCVPWASGEGAIRTITEYDVSKDIKHLKYHHKYSALNLATLAKFGTLEFRHLPGMDSISITKLKSWINMLLCLKKAARRYEYQSIPEEVSSQGFAMFTNTIFGELSSKLNYAGFQRDMVEQMGLCQDLVHGTALKEYSSTLLEKKQDKKIVPNFQKYIDKHGGNKDSKSAGPSKTRANPTDHRLGDSPVRLYDEPLEEARIAAPRLPRLGAARQR